MVFYLIFTSAAALTKESGPILASSVLFTELIFTKFSLKKLPKILPYTFPIFLFLIWAEILKLSGQKLWDDWIFAPTKNNGAIFTILHNLLTFGFLNPYWLENLLHLFVLNFNWVFTLTIIFASIIYLKKSAFHIPTANLQTLTSMILFFLIYSLSVLNLQTFTIPRYILPLVPIFLIFFSLSLNYLVSFLPKLKFPLFTFFLVLILVSLFFSVDPISQKIWGQTKIFNLNFYNLPNYLSGNDGITYNLEFLKLSKQRSQILLNQTSLNCLKFTDFLWLHPDPKNEIKEAKILNFSYSPKLSFCPS